MRITFVHQGRENIGIEYLSAVLKKAGHEVKLVSDYGLFGKADNIFYMPVPGRILDRRQRVVSEIERTNPDLVCFSVYTGTYIWALDIAGKVKKKRPVRTVFGGIHATMAPEAVINNEEVDFVIEGEGEAALAELAGCISSGRSYENIKNLWYKNNGTVRHNERRPPVSDIDGLPLPDKELFAGKTNHAEDYLMLTNRGCICSCTYCCENYMNRIYRGYHRRRSVDSVMRELRYANDRYRLRAIWFIDSIFFNDKTWLRELMKRYGREIGVPFRCFGHVYFFDEEVAALLKNNGCYAVEFGLQTLNETIRREVLGCLGSNSQAEKAFRLCDEMGIKYDIDHMFGLPQEKEEDHIRAAVFYSGLRRLNRIKCHNLTFFPRLEINDAAVKNGLITREDLVDIDNGRTGNFLNIDSVKNADMRKMNRNFKNLFKIMPLLPESTVKGIISSRTYRFFRFIPGPVVVALQVTAAFIKRDYRYFMYMRNYPRWIIRSLFG